MGSSRKFINIEIKAKCSDISHVIDYLNSHNAKHVGKSEQTDTYFKVKRGRLKVREDPIQNLVIYYEREEYTEAKQSNVTMFEYDPKTRLKETLAKTNGILVEVKKTRDVYRIDNIKFNVDHVEGLGDFVEIEADDLDGKLPKDRLQGQVDQYMAAFGIKKADIINASYSDLLLGRTPKTI